MIADIEADLALAHRLADAARAVSMARFRQKLRQWNKPDGSIVTDADEAVEDTIRTLLRAERPQDAMLGEERGQTGDGARRWIVDGIDGTHSFAAGATTWGTLIALELNGEIVVGVCDEPPIERRYWAARGAGAFRADTDRPPAPLRVTGAQELHAARTFIPPPQWLRDERARAAAAALAAATMPETPTDHPALQVASGGYELAVFFLGGPWDLAAPSIVVEEAGGRFTDLDGARSVFGGGGIFSNGRLHEAALRLAAAPWA